MQRLHAVTLIASVSNFRTAISTLGLASTPDDLLRLENAVNELKNTLAGIPLSQVVEGQLGRLLKQIRGLAQERSVVTDDLQAVAVIAVAKEFYNSLLTELCTALYVMVPASRKAFYNPSKPVFGAAVHARFPDAAWDVTEAVACLAFDRFTACVFHLMRALELALHDWTRELGVQQSSAIELENWKNILDAAKTRIDALAQQPKSPQKDAELAYFGETRAHFLSIKDAWRNHVAHARVTYDEAQAVSVLNHVNEFMNRLALHR